MKKATKSYQNKPVGPMKSSTMKKATKSYQNEPVGPMKWKSSKRQIEKLNGMERKIKRQL
jgi:hypothetical protein